MAEVVAGLYAAETVIEGAAIGAFAVSRPTAPLHLNFCRISLPAKSDELQRSGHTFNIVKGKAYCIGGEPVAGDSRSVLVVTLPVASSTDGEGDLAPLDYEVVVPKFKEKGRPLAPQSETQPGADNDPLLNRVGHTTTAVGDKLYIWGGQLIGSNSEDENLFNHLTVFDPLTNTYDLLHIDVPNCHYGLPPPRRHHAATSYLPQESETLPPGQGTIFIHGGVSTADHHKTLRDTWALDIGKRTWTRLPDIPDPGPSEIANEGKLAYVNGKLWRLGDGFGRAMFLDISDNESSNNRAGKWEVINFGTEATDTDTAASGPPSVNNTTGASALPMPRLSATVLPVTTGSGRTYLLYFMGEEPKTGVTNDFWSFQTPSEDNTASSLKDSVRDAVASKVKKSWSSGKYSWAKCEIEVGTGKEGNSKHEKSPAAWPEGEDLRGFASDVWNDQGGNVFIIWGGKRGDGMKSAVDGGWVVTVS